MSPKRTVRDAVVGDAGGICAIYNAALAERQFTFETKPRSADDFESRIVNPHLPLLVAHSGDGIVGWAGLAPYSDRACYAGVGECSVYVASGARGQGIGTELTEALAGDAEARAFHKLVGKLFPENIASVRLVERCGFSRVGLHHRHGQLQGAWRDVLVVERLLESHASTTASVNPS